MDIMKRILKILIVILFCLSINVHAGTDTYDREELKNKRDLFQIDDILKCVKTR